MSDTDSLLSACKHGDVPAVINLLETDQDNINDVGDDGLAPLHEAVSGGHETVVDLLLHHRDIDVDVRDVAGQTPLIIASSQGQGLQKILSIFFWVKKGADVILFRS